MGQEKNIGGKSRVYCGRHCRLPSPCSRQISRRNVGKEKRKKKKEKRRWKRRNLRKNQAHWAKHSRLQMIKRTEGGKRKNWKEKEPSALAKTQSISKNSKYKGGGKKENNKKEPSWRRFPTFCSHQFTGRNFGKKKWGGKNRVHWRRYSRFPKSTMFILCEYYYRKYSIKRRRTEFIGEDIVDSPNSLAKT